MPDQYNFLNPKLLPKATTTAPTIDGYGAENLVSDNVMVRARGFLAYTSIKPPVNIDFELICPISIRYISICTKIGTQKTTCLEILAKNDKNDFNLIGKAHFDTDGVIFLNSRYYNRENFVNTNYHISFLNGSAFRSFINANQIRIRICRTNYTVPCLGPVEIWGLVSKSCSSKTLFTIKKLMEEKGVAKREEISYVSEKDDFEVPDDFKDALTFDVMMLPMTLPSGHTIDQSTLEKCIQNDACYGRKGTDPFTGVPFTSNIQPKLNVALKSRIDMFLLQNSNRPEIISIPRTLGRKRLNNTTDLGYVNVNKKVILNDVGDHIPSSLEDAMAKVMNSENFISFTKEDVKEKNKCNSCNCDSNLYVLPCKHLYCRNCVLKLCAELKCTCMKPFLKSDVEKVP